VFCSCAVFLCVFLLFLAYAFFCSPMSSSKWFVFQRIYIRTVYAFPITPEPNTFPTPSNSPWFDHLSNIWWSIQTVKLICFHNNMQLMRVEVLMAERIKSMVILGCNTMYFDRQLSKKSQGVLSQRTVILMCNIPQL
jgi:hypothetical protein